ncbi:MAG: hypothetical protein GX147_05145 [Deltaproteobacteria bacterium]|jgi:hypothetical protein|nr:hypothetical protein [Deltaproteobacteria bacterium]
MSSINNRNRKGLLASQRGIALITAIMACVILFALAVLIIYLSTGDLRVSSRTVGDKKAGSAAESGVHQLVRHFDPDHSTWDPDDADSIYGKKIQVDAESDSSSSFEIGPPARPKSGIYFRHIAGYDITGGKGWGMTNYESVVTGQNDHYSTETTITTGIGYGPVKTDTILE